MKQPARHPVRQFYGSAMQTTLFGLRAAREVRNNLLDKWGYTGRRVLGYKLPEWQRKEKWSDAQCVRFLESIWLGVSIGAFMVNDTQKPEHSQVLLDGQQRLQAIERYFDDELAVQGEDGQAYRWSDLTDDEQAQFLRIPFPWLETRYNTDAELRAAYDRHNFGGTPHVEDERATDRAGA